MGHQDAVGYCGRCNCKVIVHRSTPNHFLHVLLSLLTCGIWMFVWFFSRPGPWECSQCNGLASRSWGDSLGLDRKTIEFPLESIQIEQECLPSEE